MKIILTTDFSKSSEHAIDFAIQMFGTLKKEISYFLLHGFKPMSPYSNRGAIPVITNPSWEAESKKWLKNDAKKLSEKTNTKVTPIFEVGTINEVIQKIEAREKPNLFVMSTREKSFLERMTFGSNTLQVISNANTSVIAIPLEAKFDYIKKIVFAADFEPIGISLGSLMFFKEMARSFNAKLDVLHVYESEDHQKEMNLRETELHNKHLQDLAHTHCSIINESVHDGILSYIKQNSPNMLVMTPRDQNFLDKLFRTSDTRKMTYETNVPLLILK